MADSTNPPEIQRVAVVGAGVAGLSAAMALRGSAANTTVYERHFCPGGRMATHRDDGLQWDHGAQYFTVSDRDFSAETGRWHEAGWVAPWHGRLIGLPGGGEPPFDGSATRLVSVPRMNALAARLGEQLDLRCDVQVTAIRHTDGQWRVEFAGAEAAHFDAVVVATTAAQALRLLDANDPLAARLAEISFSPCWAAMVALDDPMEYGFDAAFVDDSVLAWAARDGSKPGRNGERWVLHADGDWSRRHADENGPDVVSHLWRRLGEMVSDALPEPVVGKARYWSQARVVQPLGDTTLVDQERRIALCGDWCLDARVEAAWLSGRAAGLALSR